MLDDPFALLSKAWLVQEMGFQVGRARPRSRVGGRQLARAGWNVHFRELLEQPGLLRDYLGPYVERTDTSDLTTTWSTPSAADQSSANTLPPCSA